jgi:hypothetical protein
MELFDRLSYAAIGFFFGALMGSFFWFVTGFKSHGSLASLHWSLFDWIKYAGGAFAVIGFIFRDRVGDAFGGLVNGIYEYETRGISWGLWLIVLLAIFLFVVFRGTYQ